jgi:2C-methyl-D-erythritol 2,4-cyclodiphosphate synthase
MCGLKNYIEDLMKVLPEGQKDILNQYLNVGDQSSSDTTESALEAKINELLKQVGQGQMTMQLRPQDGQTNSEDYNQTLREIVADFNTLYTESGRLDALITNHKQLTNSVLATLAKNIKQLEAHIDSINLLADNTEGYGTASKETFSDASMMESDRDT